MLAVPLFRVLLSIALMNTQFDKLFSRGTGRRPCRKVLVRTIKPKLHAFHSHITQASIQIFDFGQI